jgi:hypothetical protein
VREVIEGGVHAHDAHKHADLVPALESADMIKGAAGEGR